MCTSYDKRFIRTTKGLSPTNLKTYAVFLGVFFRTHVNPPNKHFCVLRTTKGLFVRRKVYHQQTSKHTKYFWAFDLGYILTHQINAFVYFVRQKVYSYDKRFVRQKVYSYDKRFIPVRQKVFCSKI